MVSKRNIQLVFSLIIELLAKLDDLFLRVVFFQQLSHHVHTSQLTMSSVCVFLFNFYLYL